MHNSCLCGIDGVAMTTIKSLIQFSNTEITKIIFSVCDKWFAKILIVILVQ